MLFQPLENLEELIVRLLATKPGLTTDAIYSYLVRTNRNYSLPAVYKELRKLLVQQVIIKQERRFFLSTTWTLEYISLAKTLEDYYVHKPSTVLELPAPGKSMRWKFDSLLLLDDFASHVVLNLLTQSKERVVYSWNPHPWFWLVRTSQEIQYLKGLKSTNSMFCKVIGGNTALDRWATRFWTKEETLFRILPGFEDNQSVYYNVVDNYVSSFTLDASATAEIDKIYKTNKSYDELDIAETFALFDKKYRLSFKLENRASKAELIRKRFRKIFVKGDV